jgi:hypothetical protein
LIFNSFQVQPNFDALYVYNGSSINSPIFDSGNPATVSGFPAGGYYGITAPGPFTSTDESGCITLRFRSDNFLALAGWDVDISCELLCSEEVNNTDNDGWGSLRRTIACADPGTTIEINPIVNYENFNLDSPIQIDKNIIVELGSGNNINLVPSETGPAFHILSSGQLELDYLTIIAGTMKIGGAIVNKGTLILNNVNLHSNEEGNTESIIENNGTIILRGNSHISKE